jgi:uncharacterized protein YbaR (Trm112 family)
MSELKLSDEEVKEVNAIVANLQSHVSKMQDEMRKREFSRALTHISEAIKGTTCPLCKEKLAYLSTKIIDSKIACKNNGSKCDLLLRETIDKAEEIKNDFIPISTEKRFKKEKKLSSEKPVKPLPIPEPIRMINSIVESILFPEPVRAPIDKGVNDTALLRTLRP